jgi:hypothetical protein
LSDSTGKPPVIPNSSVPVFKFENSLVPASRVPTPLIPVFHIIFHINLIKNSFRQGSPLGITDKSPRQSSPAGIIDKSPRQAQLLKIIKTGITGVGTSEFGIPETGITGVGTRGAGKSVFRDNWSALDSTSSHRNHFFF